MGRARATRRPCNETPSSARAVMRSTPHAMPQLPIATTLMQKRARLRQRATRPSMRYPTRAATRRNQPGASRRWPLRARRARTTTQRSMERVGTLGQPEPTYAAAPQRAIEDPMAGKELAYIAGVFAVASAAREAPALPARPPRLVVMLPGRQTFTLNWVGHSFRFYMCRQGERETNSCSRGQTGPLSCASTPSWRACSWRHWMPGMRRRPAQASAHRRQGV